MQGGYLRHSEGFKFNQVIQPKPAAVMFIALNVKRDTMFVFTPLKRLVYTISNEDQCVISPTFCRAIYTLVETNVSIVLHFVGISIH